MTTTNSLTLMCTADGLNVTSLVIMQHWPFAILGQQHTQRRTSTHLLAVSWVTTDHGSNVVAALKNGVQLDCLCHRLHTVLDSAWKDTREEDAEAAAYEEATSDLCRYAKQSTGIQEQLPKSLKHGGDKRPWISMCQWAESVEVSYEAVVTVLPQKS